MNLEALFHPYQFGKQELYRWIVVLKQTVQKKSCEKNINWINIRTS